MKRWLFTAAAALAMTTPTVASADVITPEQEECEGKEVGDSCSGGTCQQGERCRATPDGPEDCTEVLMCEPAEESEQEGGCAQAGDAGVPVLSLLAGLALVGLVRRRDDEVA